MSEILNFDQDLPGLLPPRWEQGVTGNGTAHWAVRKDASVEMKFKALAGSEDQAGGVVWRWKDGENYYVARGNALENNVSLYYTQKGRRITLRYVDAPVAAGVWHTLRAEFSGVRIRVSLDGKTYIDIEDQHIAGGGAVGLWTKADSVTAFDDFSYGSRP